MLHQNLEAHSVSFRIPTLQGVEETLEIGHTQRVKIICSEYFGSLVVATHFLHYSLFQVYDSHHSAAFEHEE